MKNTEIEKSGFIHTATGKAVIAAIAFFIIGELAGCASQVQKQVEQEQLENAAESVKTEEDTGTIRALYEQVLQDVSEGKYEFTMLENIFEGYGYFLLDMNGDGVGELIVSARSTPGTGAGMGVFIFDDCRVFTAEYIDAAWVLQPIGGEVEAIEEYTPSDGSGFYALMDYGRATGDAEICRITIQNGELLLGDGEHYSAIDGTLDSFEAINPPVVSFNITDLSGLETAVRNFEE